MGKNWFDVKVWKANNLRFLEHPGEWKSIYKMLAADREYDYFSRGLNEIVSESSLYPELAIEKRLALIYDRDFIYYLSKTGPNAGSRYREIIQKAMRQAKISGLIGNLVYKYWGADFNYLNYAERIKIQLQTPQ